MLTPDQEAYIATIPEGDAPHIARFDPRARTAAEKLLAELQALMPYAAIHYFGSTKLGIAGENGIDIVVIAGERLPEYEKALTGKYGEPKLIEHGVVRRWKSTIETYPVDIFAVDKPTHRIQDDLDTHQVLEARGDLRNAYERLKFASVHDSRREYTRKKFEFFNDILHPHSG